LKAVDLFFCKPHGEMEMQSRMINGAKSRVTLSVSYTGLFHNVDVTACEPWFCLICVCIYIYIYIYI